MQCEKLKVWKPEVANDEKNKDNLYLQLENSKRDDVLLIAVDYKGNKIDRGNILLVDNDLHCIIALEGIAQRIPLKTDIKESVLIYIAWQLQSTGRGHGISILDIIKHVIEAKEKSESTSH
jgi:hypothetical protein